MITLFIYLTLQAHIQTAPFHVLEPMSAVGYTWEYSMGTAALPELEIQEGFGVGASEVLDFFIRQQLAVLLSADIILLTVLALGLQFGITSNLRARCMYHDAYSLTLFVYLFIRRDTTSRPSTRVSLVAPEHVAPSPFLSNLTNVPYE